MKKAQHLAVTETKETMTTGRRGMEQERQVMSLCAKNTFCNQLTRR